ncbi:GPN-loop GTPase 3 [Hetaerina americana]|uniref:GPN-loop GTPase 3 n=1 Tax=Hetaerina americana TaxID=62018 RepID=UPI003A7F3490
MRYAQLVIGPAGSGKSTYCYHILRHFEAERQSAKVVNLDPAAEHFEYEPLVDIRELIHLDDAMEDDDLKFGPNGGLVFCMEYLLENRDWLEEQLGEDDDDYILFDCPGQIELYSHMTVMKDLVEVLQNWNFRVCGVFLMDSQFMIDGAKFLAGTMTALSVMVNLVIPHVNVLSKVDLLGKSAKKQLERFIEPDARNLLSDVANNSRWHKKYQALTEALGALIEDYSLVRFYPLDLRDEENIGDLVLSINNVIQFGEDADVQIRDFDPPEEDE